MKIKRAGDVVDIRCQGGDCMQRVGDVWEGFSGGVMFRRVGDLKKFDQLGPSKSLRLDRVSIKKMARAAL